LQYTLAFCAASSTAADTETWDHDTSVVPVSVATAAIVFIERSYGLYCAASRRAVMTMKPHPHANGDAENWALG
jgi:hypothetical protein